MFQRTVDRKVNLLNKHGVFLSTVEKRWLTFQLLLAVDQVHKLGVCHGDIKLENIVYSVKGDCAVICLADFGMAGFIGKDGLLR